MFIRAFLFRWEVWFLRPFHVDQRGAWRSLPERGKAVAFVLQSKIGLLYERVTNRIDALLRLPWQLRLSWHLFAHVGNILRKLCSKVFEVRWVVKVICLSLLYLFWNDGTLPPFLLLHPDGDLVQPLVLGRDCGHIVERLEASFTCIFDREITNQLCFSACGSIEVHCSDSFLEDIAVCVELALVLRSNVV